MKDKRVVFMGTPEFSVNILNLLIDKTNVVLVVTKPDSFVGRKKVLTMTPVKEVALSENIPVLTPTNLKEEYQAILEYQPDIIITAAYGKILPKELIDYPKYGCINIHASLLPKYRGASPIQSAILNGEKITGVTLMYMDEGMDTGDIIDAVTYEIKDEDDTGSLFKNLSILGTNLLAKNLDNLLTGNVKKTRQDNDKATYTKKIERELEEIDFNNTCESIINLVKALSPSPLARCTIFDEEIKVVKAHYELNKSIVGKLYVTKETLAIGAKNGLIYLDVIKPVSKKEMNIKNYLNGKKLIK